MATITNYTPDQIKIPPRVFPKHIDLVLLLRAISGLFPASVLLIYTAARPGFRPKHHPNPLFLAHPGPTLLFFFFSLEPIVLFCPLFDPETQQEPLPWRPSYCSPTDDDDDLRASRLHRSLFLLLSPPDRVDFCYAPLVSFSLLPFLSLLSCVSFLLSVLLSFPLATVGSRRIARLIPPSVSPDRLFPAYLPLHTTDNTCYSFNPYDP